MKKWIEVEAEVRPKGTKGEWYRYYGSILSTAPFEEEIKRIQERNPHQEFRNFKIKEN